MSDIVLAQEDAGAARPPGFFCTEIIAGVCGCVAGSPAAAFVRKGWDGRR
ncbi:MAG TPA: hypothetical protein VNO26_01130 [Candidatus Limnocylindria bacterium]|nr:hypothetical protein [Candidatus Limnocylindria bacterium]